MTGSFEPASPAEPVPGPTTWRTYVAVARPFHWVKSLFALVGFAAAHVLASPDRTSWQLARLLLALVPICLVASANYIMNEIVDAPFDRLHPEKRHRPVASGRVSVAALWTACIVLFGVSVVWAEELFGGEFATALVALFVSSIAYNIPPLRLKDIPVVDVLCESFNNPIRLYLGWYATGVATAPPIVLAGAFWAFGALLMTAKRYAEYRFLADAALAGRYRASLRYYTSDHLLMLMVVFSSAFYVLTTLAAIRLAPHTLWAFPALILLVAWFFRLAIEERSIVREPEELARSPGFMLFVVAVFLLFYWLA